jgi:hypothetical protein
MRKSFTDTLRDVRAGQVIEQLDESLQQLVQQIQRTNKAGSLKLTLEIKPMKGSTEAVVVKATVTAKAPQFSDDGTVLFPTPEGNLTRSYHKQDELPGISLAADNSDRETTAPPTPYWPAQAAQGATL